MSLATKYAFWLLAAAIIVLLYLTSTKKINIEAPLLWTDEGGER